MAKSTGYFAGANGERGFVSYFEGALAPCKRVYILKGGCGCGKSGLMRRLAATAEKRGEVVERLYCAADPDSLDGVVFTGRGVAIADGTAPHELSPKLPGAADRLINLGEFWDGTVLQAKRDKIKALTDKKQGAMSRAYSLLAAMGCLEAERQKLIEGAVLWDKMHAAAMRIVKKMTPGTEFCATVRQRSVFCHKGLVSAPDYGEECTVPLKDSLGISHLFLEQLLAAAYSRGLKVQVSPSALSPDRIGALLFEDTGVLYAAEEMPQSKPLNLERFVDKSKLAAVRGKLKLLGKWVGALKEEGRIAMAESRAAHAALEDIYVPTMDFSAVDALTERLAEEIFA